ncbi:MAG: phosphate/phosphite/phosphonate ABC transporter substrate-binding protein [Candidatus Sericytochromatia bacterium]|nr:phosphate/phosphite/phosphonate ABC transporter substrate-binding protein [Candidatus Tanganyikabacteria bacterium]
MRALRLAVALAAALAVAPPAAAAVKPTTLMVGFAPWENPGEIHRIADQVTRLLARELGMKVEPRVATDYAGVVEAMRAGRVHVAFYPPAAYVLAEKRAGARVILKSLFKGKSAYYSAIITRKDSGVASLADLKGKTFAFVDPSSTSGSIYPRVMLLNAGIKPERDFRQVINAGGHDSVVLAVFNGRVDAGACYANDPQGQQAAWTMPNLLKGDAERDQIKVLAYSKPIPADNIAVRSDLDPALVEKLKRVFLQLSATPEGRERIRKLYKVDGFTSAAPADYDPVREAFAKVGFKLEK